MQKIIILDFGSQYTQLIARRVREHHVYCEIHPFSKIPQIDNNVKGIILSGSPFSTHDATAPNPDLSELLNQLPVLGVCYGAQLLTRQYGGSVMPSQIREYGRANLNHVASDVLLRGIDVGSQVWMSHGDTIEVLPEGAVLLASTQAVANAAFRFTDKPVFGIQFHPEVTHSTDGKQLIRNFLVDVCGCSQNWTPDSFIESTVAELKAMLGNDQVVLGLSGGVDSSVAAVLISKAIGKNLHCIFVDNGLLRKNEFEKVIDIYKQLELNVTGVDAKADFYAALEGLSEPEAKRKAIGRTFIEVFDREAHRISNVGWLGQGTIYPDVIESVSVNGPSVTIKSHHNVGGLPEKMKLKLVEPLRTLFKDEVREVGRAMGIPEGILGRHPFPGPGLGIRILGDITPEKVRILQEADDIFIENLREAGLYDKVWQAGTIFLPIQSVGVMGDERTYEHVVALRAVESLDGMTADWCHLPYSFLAKVSNEIINRVKGINRVVYDISSKPPATIEWE
ncbi:MAG: glutamine-hydrolyzing GMP synthase [Bacteroidia bacterium]